MREDLFAMVREFHQKFGLEYDGPPRVLPSELARFRIKFLKEELQEYKQAYQTFLETAATGQDVLVDKLDALVDLVYVALGTADLHGFDFNEAFRRVHDKNMKKVRKLTSPDAPDSKRGNNIYDVVKPPGWEPADLSDLVKPL